MSKATFYALMGLLFACTAMGSSAALPPKCLGVEDFKQCLRTQESTTYRSWCMPAEKLESCPAATWKLLMAFSGIDKVPECPIGSNPAAPLSAEKQPLAPILDRARQRNAN